MHCGEAERWLYEFANRPTGEISAAHTAALSGVAVSEVPATVSSVIAATRKSYLL